MLECLHHIVVARGKATLPHPSTICTPIIRKENGIGKGESGVCWTHEILIEIVVWEMGDFKGGWGNGAFCWGIARMNRFKVNFHGLSKVAH